MKFGVWVGEGIRVQEPIKRAMALHLDMFTGSYPVVLGLGIGLSLVKNVTRNAFEATLLDRW